METFTEYLTEANNKNKKVLNQVNQLGTIIKGIEQNIRNGSDEDTNTTAKLKMVIDIAQKAYDTMQK